MINQNLLLAGDDGYNLTKSLRFRSSASAYLSRTLTTPTNNKIWTWSGWIKRGLLSTDQVLMGTTDDNTVDGNVAAFRFTSTNIFQIFNYAGGYQILLATTQVFRDPSAWYHIVVTVDTTQATASNRVKLYVNGVQVTAFTTATYPAQNYNGFINSAIPHYQACYNNAGTGVLSFFDGYLDEINFIDGQALTPSSFGSTNASTGVWQPKKYTGTYGTNGFYLPFTDATLTSGSNAGLGKDFSGNGNYFNTNNISITAGTTYDSMTDVPTLTSATTANYCVLNAVSPLASGTISNANLTFTSGAADATCIGTLGVSSGKWYWEITATNVNASLSYIGIIGQPPASLTVDLSTPSNGYCYLSNGNKGNNNSRVSYGASFVSGDVIGVALDMDAGTLVFYKNNATQGTAYSSLSGTFSPALSDGSGASSGAVFNCNFGQRPFSYTPPTGFVALNTYNLPTSTIVKGNTVMDATTYTGNGTSLAVTNAASFKPDFVWVKCRSNAQDHILVNSVVGANINMYSNRTNAEVTNNSGGYISTINSNGFTAVTGSTNAFDTVGNTYTYVGWQWQAGQGSSSSNTSGSITSTVSVNATAGFSVVTYTGNDTSGSTVGHGLGVAPSMMIIKERSQVRDWTVYHVSTGNTGGTLLNSTGAVNNTRSGWFNNTSPSSSVFTLGGSSGNDWYQTNQTGQTYVAYCWSEIAGFSKFGSYTGNGSADGPFTYTGFRPKFIMWKRTDAVGDWIIFDTARDTYNLLNKQLVPNSSSAEAVTGGGFVRMDFLSNGFKVRSTDSYINASGGTYIYMAFAENPFKNALAR